MVLERVQINSSLGWNGPKINRSIWFVSCWHIDIHIGICNLKLSLKWKLTDCPSQRSNCDIAKYGDFDIVNEIKRSSVTWSRDSRDISPRKNSVISKFSIFGWTLIQWFWFCSFSRSVIAAKVASFWHLQNKLPKKVYLKKSIHHKFSLNLF